MTMMMSSRMLKILAWSLLVFAVLMGLYAYKMSRESPPESASGPKEAQQAETQQAPYRAVIAVKPIEPGRPIPDDAVRVEPVWIKPDGGFERLDELAGRVPRHPIGVGEPVREKHFLLGSPLAQKIEPGFRAVAIPISEETAVGGFPQPGDRVDVLLYLPQTQENERAQSRVLLKKVDLLAIGEQAEKDQGGERTTYKTARTAVLAVPEDKILDLGLGVSAGNIRLALHPADKPEEISMPAEGTSTAAGGAAPQKPEVLTLASLAESGLPAAKKTLAKESRSAAPAPAPSVVLYRGGERQVVSPR